MTWLLEFVNVDYIYPGTSQTAIQGLTLRIPIGKRCAVIGQNGCGKTTLFLLANSLYKPQKGRIFWQGKQLTYDRLSLTQHRQKVGLVFQNPEQQLIALTVEEDISYGLCNLDFSEPIISQKVEQALTEFDLISLAKRPIHQLSLGQKKRVSLADVMVLEPELLILDEPTAYLDPLHTRQLTQNLNTIHENGTTLLIATHDLEWVNSWADWIFVLDQGKLILEGTPQEVFQQHEILDSLQLGVPLGFELLSLLDEIERTSTAKQEIEKIRNKILQKLKSKPVI
ncbi:energy-coupling factor ABC transporter ATP-binding protein [Chroococcus sp. FPU101]|uniref:energy-coupling factor ABC transporter ATP-binding protein n=1 Tax=Chroococcus sp. FPU101 TaxID=1974212 RepID=UPI001A8E865A|nr:ABC transporter ATP-binding protein [Chroococcus sp. FPU101]GFE69734.1 cobalt transport protein ATP-binding subunit [Chroococcus sp. FPU101]